MPTSASLEHTRFDSHYMCRICEGEGRFQREGGRGNMFMMQINNNVAASQKCHAHSYGTEYIYYQDCYISQYWNIGVSLSLTLLSVAHRSRSTWNSGGGAYIHEF